MAKRVPLPEAVSCPTDAPIITGEPGDEEVPAWEIPGFQGSEIPKYDQGGKYDAGFDASCPPWLCDHDHEQCYDLELKPTCDACGPWMDYWKDKEFPQGYIRPNSGLAQAKGIYGHDSFTTLCGLWTTPDFFADCCDYYDPEGNQIPRKAIEYGIAYASEILYRMSGRQYPGMCERIVYPGCDTRTKLSPAYRDTQYQRDTDYIDYAPDFWGNLGHGGMSGADLLSTYGIGSCETTNCGCGGKKHTACDPACLRVPGPINQIIEIVIDGQVMPASSYAISGERDIIRTDGSSWPQVNDLTRSPFQSRNRIYGTMACKPRDKKKDWVKKWVKDLDCKTKPEVKAKLNAPDWVNEFLACHPELVQELPCCEPWVAAWLKANGLKAVQTEKHNCNDDQIIYTEKEIPIRKTWPANQCCMTWPEGSAIAQANHCCEETETMTILIEEIISPCDEIIENAVCDFLLDGESDCATHQDPRDCRYEKIVHSLEEKSTGCPAWAIRYYQGKCPPISGQLAAAALARRVAEWICVEKCLPDNTARIVADGADVRLISRFQSIYPNFPFGIAEVDIFLNAVNPAGLQRRGYAKRADLRGGKHTRIRTIR